MKGKTVKGRQQSMNTYSTVAMEDIARHAFYACVRLRIRPYLDLHSSPRQNNCHLHRTLPSLTTATCCTIWSSNISNKSSPTHPECCCYAHAPLDFWIPLSAPLRSSRFSARSAPFSARSRSAHMLWYWPRPHYTQLPILFPYILSGLESVECCAQLFLNFQHVTGVQVGHGMLYLKSTDINVQLRPLLSADTG